MNKYFLIIFLILSTFSCRKDKDILHTTTNEYPVEKHVKASIKGIVLTSLGDPIEKATIKIEGNVLESDFNGTFFFKNISANLAGSTVIISKEGFENKKIMIYPQLNATSYIRVKMKKSERLTQNNTNDKDKIFGDKNNIIKIIGNDFLQNDSKYNGDILVKWQAINNSGNEINNIADPVGYDKNFKLKGLNSFGMLAIEISNLNGKNIDIDKTNLIELKLGLVSQANLPEKVSLWHFDDIKGKWLEKGEANLITENSSTYYVAEVSKTGYWNFASQIEIEGKEFTLKSNNKSLPFTEIQVSSEDNNFRIEQISNNNGKIFLYLPKETKSEIIIQLKDNNITKEIDANNLDIDVSTSLKTSIFEGYFYNCNDEIITNGYITIFSGNHPIFYFINNSGKISIPLLLEEKDKGVSWFATDLDSKINTGLHTTDFLDPDSLNLDEVFICPEPFAIMRYGNQKHLMELKNIDVESYYLDFRLDKAQYANNSFPFLGIGEYQVNNCNCTPTIINNKGERLFIYKNLEHRFIIKEFSNPGMARGGLEAYVRTSFSGTDTTYLKIDYSVFIN